MLKNTICAFLVAVLASTHIQGLSFNATHESCNGVVDECEHGYGLEVSYAEMGGYYTEEFDCKLLVETIACLEAALCKCNYETNSPDLINGHFFIAKFTAKFNNVSQCANNNNGESIQSQVFRAITPDAGINCTQYNRTIGDLSMAITISRETELKDAEEICPGIVLCYREFDRSIVESLFEQDFHTYCEQNHRLVECMVNASCSCGQSSHYIILNTINGRRNRYLDNCDDYVPGISYHEEEIICSDEERCNASVANLDCLREYDHIIDTEIGRAGFCRATATFSNCSESLGCKCGFYQNAQFIRSLAAAKWNYVNYYQCENETGPFPNNTRLDCGDDDRFTEQEKILSITLAEPKFVLDENATCPGIHECYRVANAKSTQAHLMRDFHNICQAQVELISCLENTYCKCSRIEEYEVARFLFIARFDLDAVCGETAGKPPTLRCRGPSLCKLDNPFAACEAEYNADISQDFYNFTKQCIASRLFYHCLEDVACTCGLFKNISSPEAFLFYNETMHFLHIYNSFDCTSEAGAIATDESGIMCEEDISNPEQRKKLMLSFAETAEAGNLSKNCPEVEACFQTHGREAADALIRRSLADHCAAQEKKTLCVDAAYCTCKLNGTALATSYVTSQLELHSWACQESITLEPCGLDKGTSTARRLTVALGLVPLLLVTSLVV